MVQCSQKTDNILWAISQSSLSHNSESLLGKGLQFAKAADRKLELRLPKPIGGNSWVCHRVQLFVESNNLRNRSNRHECWKMRITILQWPHILQSDLLPPTTCLWKYHDACRLRDKYLLTTVAIFPLRLRDKCLLTTVAIFPNPASFPFLWLSYSILTPLLFMECFLFCFAII